MAHSEETKRKIGLGNKGKLLGRKRSPESIAKSVAANTKGKHFNCLICNAEFWRSPSHIKKGDCKFCSRDCYAKWRKGKPASEAFKEFCRSRVGAKSATWKGGITPEHLRIRNSSELRKWRETVFLRDKHTCQDCQARSEQGKTVYLHAHHLKSSVSSPAPLGSPSSLIMKPPSERGKLPNVKVSRNQQRPQNDE